MSLQSTIQLTSSLTSNGHKSACLNQTITFTCTVKSQGTVAINWISSELLGESRSIQFVKGLDRPGDGKLVNEVSPGVGVFSQLLALYGDEEMYTMVSDLRITALSTSTIPIILCMDSNGEQKNITFHFASNTPVYNAFLCCMQLVT